MDATNVYGALATHSEPSTVSEACLRAALPERNIYWSSSRARACSLSPSRPPAHPTPTTALSLSWKSRNLCHRYSFGFFEPYRPIKGIRVSFSHLTKLTGRRENVRLCFTLSHSCRTLDQIQRQRALAGQWPSPRRCG